MSFIFCYKILDTIIIKTFESCYIVHQAKALVDSKAAILNDPGMRAIYINPKTNDTWKEGDTYTRLNFADTLERIAKLGFQDFYQGRTAKNFVKDLRQLGGIITLQDLKDYW